MVEHDMPVPTAGLRATSEQNKADPNADEELRQMEALARGEDDELRHMREAARGDDDPEIRQMRELARSGSDPLSLEAQIQRGGAVATPAPTREELSGKLQDVWTETVAAERRAGRPEGAEDVAWSVVNSIRHVPAGDTRGKNFGAIAGGIGIPAPGADPFEAAGVMAQQVTTPGSAANRFAEALSPRWFSEDTYGVQDTVGWRIAETQAERERAMNLRAANDIRAGIAPDEAKRAARERLNSGAALLLPTSANPDTAMAQADTPMEFATLPTTLRESAVDMGAGFVRAGGSLANTLKDLTVDLPGYAVEKVQGALGLDELAAGSRAVRDWTFPDPVDALIRYYESIPDDEMTPERQADLMRLREGSFFTGMAGLHNAVVPDWVDPIDPRDAGLLNTVARVVTSKNTAQMPQVAGEDVVESITSTAPEAVKKYGEATEKFYGYLGGDVTGEDALSAAGSAGAAIGKAIKEPLSTGIGALSTTPEGRESTTGWWMRVGGTALSAPVTTYAARVLDKTLTSMGAESYRKHRVPWEDQQTGGGYAHALARKMKAGDTGHDIADWAETLLPILDDGSYVQDVATTIWNGDSIMPETMRALDTLAKGTKWFSPETTASMQPGGNIYEIATTLGMIGDLALPMDGIAPRIVKEPLVRASRFTDGYLAGKMLAMPAAEAANVGLAHSIPSVADRILRNNPEYVAAHAALSGQVDRPAAPGVSVLTGRDTDAPAVTNAAAMAWFKKQYALGRDPVEVLRTSEDPGHRVVADRMAEMFTILAVERKASEATPETPPTPKAPVDEPVVATKERRAARPNIVSEAESALVVADRDGARPIAKFNDAVYREADPIARHGAMLGQLAAHWNVSMDTAKAALQSAMSYVDPANGRPVRSPWMDEDGLASVRERHVALGLTRLRNASPAQVFRNLIRFENGEPITWVNEVSPARQRAVDTLTAMATDGKVNFTTADVKTYMAVADRMAKALVDHGVIPDTEAFWNAKEYQGGDGAKPTIGGWIDFREDANALITIARSGDLSTLFHEDAHLLRRLIPADQMAAVDAVAKERFGGWNRAAEEWFATQMESVIASGELTLSDKEKQRQPSLYKRLRDALDKAAKVVSAVLRGREMEPVHPEFAKWVQDYFFKSERIRPREVVDAEPVSRRKAPGMTPDRVEVVNQMFETLVSEGSGTARRREIHKLVNDVAYWAGLSKDEAKALHAAVKEGSDLAVLHDLAEIANGRAVDLATYVAKAAEPTVKPEFKDPQRPTKKELVAAGFVAEKGKPGLYTHPDRPERFAWSYESKVYLPVAEEVPAGAKATEPAAKPGGPVAKMLPEEERPTFRTSKGSVYTVNEDGTTSRMKAERPEHPGDFGPQRKSDGTVYVDKAGLEKLGIFQAKGGDYHSKRIRVSGDEAAIFGEGSDGREVGLATSRTKAQSQPFVGGYPVEWWDDGRVVHFGNEIVEVSPAKLTEPTPSPAAKIEPAESKARRAMEDRLTNLVAGVQNANLATSQSRALAFLRDVARVVLEQSGSTEKVDDAAVRRILGDATVNDYKTAVRQAYRDFKDRTGITDNARSEAVLTASRKVLTQVGLYDPLAAVAEPAPVAPILDIIATTVTPEDKAVAKEASAHPPLSASGSATHNQRGTRRVLVDSTGTALPVAVRRVSIDDVTPSHKLNLAWNERYDKAFQNRTDAFQRAGWLQEKVNRYNPMLAQSVDTMSPTIGAPTMWRGPDGTMHITSGNGRTLVIQLLMERAAAGDPAAQMRLQAHQAEVAAWSHALGLGTPDPRDILVFEMDAPYEAVVSFAKNSQGVPAAELSSMETVLSHADQIRHSEAVVPLEVANLPDELDVDTVKSYIQANPTAFERALAVLWPEPSERLAKMEKGGELLVDAVQGVLLGQIDRATHERMMGYGKDVVDILAACVPALVDLDRGTDTAPDLSVYRLSSYFADAVELWQSAVASGRKSPEALGKYAAERSTQTVFAGGRPLPISKLSVALAMSMMQARTPGGVARRARALVDGLARAKRPALFARPRDHHAVALEYLTRGTGNAELIPAEIPDTHTAAQDVARKMEMTGIEARRAEDPALVTEPQGYAELKESVGAAEDLEAPKQDRLFQDVDELSRTPLADQAERDIDNAIDSMMEDNPELGPDRARMVRDGVQSALRSLRDHEYDARDANDRALAAQPSDKAAENRTYWLTNDALREARLRFRVTLENEIRKAKATPPRPGASTRTGSDAVAARLSAERKFGSVTDVDARDAARLLEMLGNPLEDAAFRVGKRVGGSATALGAYDFANDVIAIAKRAFDQGVSTRTLAHEIGHRVSMWLPKDKAQALFRQYIKERRAAIKDHPTWFDKNGHLTPEGKRDPGSYRWVDIDEWFAERFADHAHKRLRQWDAATLSVMDAARFMLEKVKARILDFFGVDRVPAVVEDLMAGRLDAVIQDAQRPVRQRLIQVQPTMGPQPKGPTRLFQDAPVKVNDHVPDVTGRDSGAYGGATHAHQAVAWIAGNSKDPKYRALARRILPLVPTDVPITIIQTGTTYTFGRERNHVPNAIHGARGVYTWDARDTAWPGRIWLRGTSFADGSLGLRDETVLHEAIHAVVNRRIHEGNLKSTPVGPSTRGAKMFYDLQNQLADWYTQNQRKGTLPEFAKDETFLNAINSVHELATYGLTNEAVQAAFKQITLPGTRVTVWTKFIDAIRGILGLTTDADNALVRVIDATNVILEDVLGPDGVPIPHPEPIVRGARGGAGETILFQDRRYPNAAEAAAATGDTLYTAEKSTDKGPRFRAAFVSWKGPAFTDTDLRTAAVNAPPDVRRVLGEWEAAILDPKNKGDASRALNAAMPTITDQGLVDAMGEAAKLMRGEVLGERPTNSYGVMISTMRAKPLLTREQLNLALGYRADQRVYDAVDLNARVAAYAVTSLLQGREMPTRYTRPGNRVAVPVTRVGAVRARALSILGDLPKRVAASVHHVTEPPSAALPNGRVEPGKAPTNRGIPEVVRLSEQDAHRFLAIRDWMEDTGWADSLPLSVRRLTLEDIVRGSRYDARTGLVLGSDLTLEGWSQMVGAVMDSQSGIAPFRGKAERHSLAASLVWYVAQRVSDLDATPRDAGIVRKMLAKVRSVTSGFVLDAIANPLLPWEQYAPDMPEYVRPLYEKYARTVGRLPGDMVEALKQAIVKLEDAGVGKDTLTLAALRDLSSTLHGLDAPISVTRGAEGVSDLEILRGWLYADAVPDPNVKTNAPYRRVTGDQFVPHDLPRVTVSGGHPITNPVQEVQAHGRVVERVVRRQGTLDSNTLDAITALRDGTLDEQQAVFLLRKVQAALANANEIGLDILSSVAGRSGDADTVRKAIEARGAQGIALDAYEAFYTGDWTRQRGIAREGSIEWMSELLNKAPVKTDLWVFEVMNNLRTRWATERFVNELVDHQYVASLTDIWKMGHRDTVPDLATQAMFSERVAKAMSAILLGQDLGTTSGITAEGTRVGGMDNYTGITDVERAVAHTLIARMGMRPDLASSRKAMKGRVAGSAVTRTFSDAFYAPRSDVMKPPSERAAAAASMEGVTPTMPEMTLAGTSPIMYAPLLERMRELQAEQGPVGQFLAGVLKDRETMRKTVEAVQDYARQYKGMLISGGPNGVAAAALAGSALLGGASLPAAALAGAAGLVWAFRPRIAAYATNALGAVLQGHNEYGLRWLGRMIVDEVTRSKGVRASSIAARATRHSIALDRMAKPLEVVTRFIGSVADKAYQRASDDIAFVDANGRVWTDSAIIEYGETHGLDGTQAKFESAEKARHAVDRISREYAPTTPMGQMYNAVAKFFGRHALAENYRKLYEANDTFFRYVYFTRGLMDGEAPHDALKRALNATFDYSTTAPIDRWVNSVFLFWMFQRRTVDMVLRSLVTNPHRVLGPLRFLRDQDLKSGYVQDNEDDHVAIGETVPDYMAGRYAVNYLPIAGSPNAAAMKLGLQEALTVNAMRIIADVSGVDLMALMGRGRPEIQLGFNLMNSAAGNEWVSFFRKGTVQDSSYFDVPLWFVRADQTMFGGSLGKRFDWFVEPTDDPSRYAAPGYPFVYRIPPEKYAAWEIFRNTAGMATIFGNGDIDARAGGWTTIVNENVMEFIGQMDPQNAGGFRADVGDINRANGTLVPAALTGPRDFLGRENEALRNVGVGMGVVKPPYAVQADIRRQADEAAKAKLEQLRKEAPPVSPTSTPVNSDQAKPGAPMGMQPDKPMGLFK